MIAFSGIAESLTGMGQKGMSAMMMVEKGLHSAGMALMFFNPAVGMAVIAGTALFEVFEKISRESVLTADGIEKLVAANDKAAKSFRDAATEAIKSGGRKDLILSLQQQANALDNTTRKTLGQAKAELDVARAKLQHILATNAQTIADETGDNKRTAMTKAQERLTEATKTYVAVLAYQAARRAIDEAAEKANQDILTKRGDILHQLYLQTAPHVELVKKLAEAQTRLDALNHKILSTTDPAKLKAMEAEHEALMKLVQDYKTYAKQTEDSSKAQMDWAQLAVGLAQDTQKAITAALEGGKKAQKSILEAMGRDMLKTTGESLQKMLQAKAIAAFADPLTVPIGIAELAASAIIGGLTGAIGGGGGDTATPAPSAATGQNNVQTPAANGNQGNQTQLQVYVQGGVIDDNFAANLAKRLSDVVQFNNVQLVSSFSRS